MDALTISKPIPNLQRATIADLRAELAKCLSLTANSLMRAAEIWRELMRRGENVDFRTGLLIYIPRIARGELAAEAVVAFAGQRLLLDKLVGFSLDEQRRFAAGGFVRVAEHTGDGEIRGVDKPLARLSTHEVETAFAAGEVRALDVQIKMLERHAPKKKARRSTGVQIRADAVAGHIIIGRMRFDPLDLTPALKKLGLKLLRVEPAPK